VVSFVDKRQGKTTADPFDFGRFGDLRSGWQLLWFAQDDIKNGAPYFRAEFGIVGRGVNWVAAEYSERSVERRREFH
jgi:hypothetical protein